MAPTDGTAPKGTLDKVEEALAAANRIALLVNPLAAFAGTTAAVVLKLMRGEPVDPAAFQKEYDAYQANRAGLKDALDEFHQKYPQAAPPDAPPV